jgi:hypothetical protein
MANFEITFNINGNGITNPSHVTENFFDLTFNESNQSPIDNFLEKIDEFNILIGHLCNPSTLLSEKIKITNYNLILLGQISCVESYIREIFRKLILIDKHSFSACSSLMLTFTAANNYEKEILPEALMELYSFASKKNITEALKNLLDIKGNLTINLENILIEFEKICQLRHCMIHRFGKLGSNNALKLGIEKHIECLEKPLSLNDTYLFDTYNTCRNVGLILNNYLFKKIMNRTVEEDYWSWNFNKDKKLFTKYYDIFQSLAHPDNPMLTKKNYYDNFRNEKKQFELSNRRKKNV